MKAHEALIVTTTVVLILVLWLGFAVHRSPRFPGSLAGGVLGVSAALLMLVPLAYSLVKRVQWVKTKVVTWLPLPRLLTWHVYTGLLGAILAILHSAHRFDSWMGILLTAAMLIVIASGFVGRHFLRFVSEEMREQQANLRSLRAAFDALLARLPRAPTPLPALMSGWGLRSRLAEFVAGDQSDPSVPSDPRSRLLSLSEAIADVEYAIAAQQFLKQRFNVWLKVHIGASLVFYALLVLHIWSGLLYGLRWFS